MHSTKGPASYLECRFDRVMKLRVLHRMLQHRLAYTHTTPERVRLVRRMDRAGRHLQMLGGLL